MHRRASFLSYRPKTSSATAAAAAAAAADDDASLPSASAAPAPWEPAMKRTASQTFPSSCHDLREPALALNAVTEPAQLCSSASSLSRAIGAVAGSFARQKTRRRLSSFSSSSTIATTMTTMTTTTTSSAAAATPITTPTTTPSRRRGSIQTLIDALPSSAAARKQTADYHHHHHHHHHHQRLPLQHHDSASPSFPLSHPQTSSRQVFSLKRLGSIRRRAATAGPTAEVLKPAHLAPVFLSSGSAPGQSTPGAAARQAAAAANQDRQNQLRREQEDTRRFLNGLVPPPAVRDEDIKDNESGVGMVCASSIVGPQNQTDKKPIDPFQRLPAELATAVLSNLDAASLVRAERVSRSWYEHASSLHVWRTVFLRQYQPEIHPSSASVQMGGAGVGRMSGNNPAPAQDWKRMLQARTTINRRWKAGTPAAIYLNGHTDSVYCCQFDEHKAITGSRDRTIRVWDLKTYQCLKVYGGPNHRPVANTPPVMEERPERVISYPSLNGTHAGNDLYHVPSDYHNASILCLQYDGEIMVTGSSDFTCIVWDITGQDFVPMYRLRGHEAGVLDVCLDEKYIISCSKDAMIKVWDRKTGNCIRTLKGHRGPVNAVQLRRNFLVSASGDGVAKLWNLETGVAIKDFPSEDRGLAAVEFSDDAQYVLAGGNDHVVYKFDASTGNLIHSRVKHDALVRSLFLDAVNGRIVSGSYDQSIQVSDYETGQTYAVYKNWTTSWILSAKSDYRRVVATSQDGRTLILDFGHNVAGGELLLGSQ